MNDQNRKINYAGYGLFADEKFGRTLFGENTPNFVVEQKGYELVVLEFKDLPENIQKDVPPTFRMYAARRNEDASVWLRVWNLTPAQKELADHWNYEDILYSRETFMSDINPRPVEIDTITNRGIGNTVDGLNYEPYLNDKETVLRFARESHEASLLKEGRFSGERMH
jgi:hypothetical protein